MSNHKATPEQWAELRARVEELEAKYETQRLATLEWGKDVDKVKRWSDQHLQRIEKLEAAQPIDEEENNRRFHACMDLIRNATPEQIRAAAGLPERKSLVGRVALAISGCEDSSAWEDEAVNWAPEARAAIREVAAWLREQRGWEHGAWALEQEAER
jgi:hypothetical protein